MKVTWMATGCPDAQPVDIDIDIGAFMGCGFLAVAPSGRKGWAI
jgi:hypothetical protein